MNIFFESPGFLGTGASLLADLTVVAYVLLIAPAMILGLVFARRGQHRPQHKWLMVAVTLINWLLITLLMLAAFLLDVAPNLGAQPGNPHYWLPALHGLLGLPAQLLATYIVIRMLVEDAQVARAKRRGERDLRRYWFKAAKSTMRLVLILWLLTTSLGIITYLTRYNVITMPNLVVPAPAATPETAPPAATDEVSDPAGTPEVEG